MRPTGPLLTVLLDWQPHSKHQKQGYLHIVQKNADEERGLEYNYFR